MSLSPPLPLVRFEHVSLCYGTACVFKDLSFQIERGKHCALLGRNGSGKSSLLRLIQGELRPSSPPALYAHDAQEAHAGYDAHDAHGGHHAHDAQRLSPQPGMIFWAFEDCEERSALAAREHSRLVSAEQQANYVRRGWDITGEEILLSGLDNAPMVYGELSSACYLAAGELAEAAGAAHLLSAHAPAMSQGQLRLMLILRALMGGPALLLLDEPFDGLDQDARKAVGRCLEVAVERGCTLLVTAHRRGDIPACIRLAMLLEDGRLHAVDLSALQSHGPFSDTLPAMGMHYGRGPQPPPRRSLADSLFLRALAARKSPLLRLRNVDVYIDRRKVLEDINWQVEPGEHWVLSGPNGSGKSTLMRLLYGGEFAAWGGALEWCGGLRPAQEELRMGVGFVSDRLQHRYEYDLSAEAVVVSGLRGSIGLYEEPEEAELELARYWLGLLGIASFASRPLYSLSGGTARKALLARALAGSPPVLLLDEPCTGLDAASRALFFNALSVLADQGVTLIYASHHEEDRAAFFNKELRLEKGRVAACSR